MAAYQDQRLAQGKFSIKHANAWLARQMKPFIEYQLLMHLKNSSDKEVGWSTQDWQYVERRLGSLINSIRDQWLQALREAALPMGELSLSSLDQSMLPAGGWPKSPVAVVAVQPLSEEAVIAALKFFKNSSPDGQAFPPAAKDILESEGLIITA